MLSYLDSQKVCLGLPQKWGLEENGKSHHQLPDDRVNPEPACNVSQPLDHIHEDRVIVLQPPPEGDTADDVGNGGVGKMHGVERLTGVLGKRVTEDAGLLLYPRLNALPTHAKVA